MAAKNTTTEIQSVIESLDTIKDKEGVGQLAGTLTSVCKMFMTIPTESLRYNAELFRDQVIKVANYLVLFEQGQLCLDESVRRKVKNKIRPEGKLNKCLKHCEPLIRGNKLSVLSLRFSGINTLKKINLCLTDRLNQFSKWFATKQDYDTQDTDQCALIEGENQDENDEGKGNQENQAREMLSARGNSELEQHSAADRDYVSAAADRHSPRSGEQQGNNNSDRDDDRGLAPAQITPSTSSVYGGTKKEFKYDILIYHHNDDTDIADEIRENIEKNVKLPGKPIGVKIFDDYHIGLEQDRLHNAMEECKQILKFKSETTRDERPTSLKGLRNHLMADREEYPSLIYAGETTKLDSLVESDCRIDKDTSKAVRSYDTDKENFHEKIKWLVLENRRGENTSARRPIQLPPLKMLVKTNQGGKEGLSSLHLPRTSSPMTPFPKEVSEERYSEAPSSIEYNITFSPISL